MMGKNMESLSSVEDARQKILAVRDEVSAMGGNDFEIPAFKEILEKLDDGSCEPSEALRQANEIRSRKEDYH